MVDQFKKASNKLLVEIFADHPGQSGAVVDSSGGGGKGKLILEIYDFKLDLESSTGCRGTYLKNFYFLNISFRTTGIKYLKTS